MKPHKQQRQSAAHATAVLQSQLMDLHLIAMKMLRDVKARRSLIGPIERATTNAVLAFEQAIVGFRQRYQVRRSHAALVVCRKGFAMLCFEGYLQRRAFDEIRRRVDQLTAVLSRLEQAPAAEWESISIPPLDPPCADEKKDRALIAMQRVSERVAAVLDSLGEIIPNGSRRESSDASPLAKRGDHPAIADAA